MHKIENCINSNGIAILPGPRISFLDHLMPLCHLWKIPLLCTDAWVYTCAQTYYPGTSLIFADQSNFQQILTDYQTFVTVEPCRLHPHALQFGDFLYQGKGTTIAGFHGNPAKFREEYWIERYAQEDIVLIYGNYLVDYLKEKGVWQRIKKAIAIGNLRRAFYLEHKAFFDKAAQAFLFSERKKTTYFWAPTWSFPQWQDPCAILDALPQESQLLLKLHPFTHRLFPEQVAALKERYGMQENLRICEEIPLIYPLLDKADIFLGDRSSVAFDFLVFDRPLFFFGEKDYAWATRLKAGECPFKVAMQKDQLSEERKKAYHYVFEGHWNSARATSFLY